MSYRDVIWTLRLQLTQGCSNCVFIKTVQGLEGLNVALIVQGSTQGEARCSRVSWGKILSIAPFMGKYFCPFGRGQLSQRANKKIREMTKGRRQANGREISQRRPNHQQLAICKNTTKHKSMIFSKSETIIRIRFTI